MSGVVLEVAVGDPRDVPGAADGGADRLHVEVPGPACALSPEPALVSAICRESDLPVFVLLRLNESWSTTGGEFARLVGPGEDHLGCGAPGAIPHGAWALPPGYRPPPSPPPVVAPPPAAPAARRGADRGVAARHVGR